MQRSHARRRDAAARLTDAGRDRKVHRNDRPGADMSLIARLRAYAVEALGIGASGERNRVDDTHLAAAVSCDPGPPGSVSTNPSSTAHR